MAGTMNNALVIFGDRVMVSMESGLDGRNNSL